MRLTSKNVSMVVALIVAALSGLLVVQAFLLHSAYLSKQQAFQRNVMAALGTVTQKLSTFEAYAITFQTDSSLTQLSQKKVVKINGDSTFVDSQHALQFLHLTETDSTLPAVWVDNNMLHFKVGSEQRVRLESSDPITGERVVVIDTVASAGDHSFPLDSNRLSCGQLFWKLNTDSFCTVVSVKNDIPGGIFTPSETDDSRQIFIEAALARLDDAEQKPIEERLDQRKLESILASSMEEADLGLDYAYGVYTAGDDTLRIAKPISYADQLLTSDFRARLFPNDLFSKPSELVVYFPEHTFYLWRQMGPLVIPTVILMLIVVGCFVFTIRTIVQQRRMAGLMVDFVNNMTHEFKTPISTVQLAGEAIDREDIVTDPEKVRHFNQMILNENRRMRNQTEKILQMAVLEEGDFDLKIEDVDVHKVIDRAVEGIALHVENRQGKVECLLQAEHHVIKADPVHFGNVIHNLLDNANKYSPEKPHIRIVSKNENGFLNISIADNGIGISPEDRKMVFDKYFRVSQGNVHDVKGFGLGLSYVKMMVEAHQGSVDIDSYPDRGTRVDLKFPESIMTRR